jgi:thymidine phosphorylase
VQEALAVLSGGGDARLCDVTLRLCREAMVLQGRTADEAERALAAALADGSALSAWERITLAHGGDPDPECLARPRSTVEVTAATSGFVTGCDGEDLGRVAVEVGAGRRRVEDELAHGAGVMIHARIGDRVDPGQPLATLLLGEREVDEDRLVRRIREAFTVGPEAVDAPDLILGTAEDIAP